MIRNLSSELRNRKLTLVVAVVVLATLLTVPSAASAQTATVSMDDVELPAEDESDEVAVTVDAPNGIGVADVNLSVDTSAVRITDVTHGEDADPAEVSASFDVADRTDSSATVEYTNIGEVGEVNGFEIAVIEFEAVDQGTADIDLSSPNFADDDADDYEVEVSSPTVTVGEEVEDQEGVDDTADGPEDPEEDDDTADTQEEDDTEITDTEADDVPTQDGTDDAPATDDDDTVDDGEDETDQEDTPDEDMPGFTVGIAVASLLSLGLYRTYPE